MPEILHGYCCPVCEVDSLIRCEGPIGSFESLKVRCTNGHIAWGCIVSSNYFPLENDYNCWLKVNVCCSRCRLPMPHLQEIPSVRTNPCWQMYAAYCQHCNTERNIQLRLPEIKTVQELLTKLDSCGYEDDNAEEMSDLLSELKNAGEYLTELAKYESEMAMKATLDFKPFVQESLPDG